MRTNLAGRITRLRLVYETTNLLIILTFTQIIHKVLTSSISWYSVARLKLVLVSLTGAKGGTKCSPSGPNFGYVFNLSSGIHRETYLMTVLYRNFTLSFGRSGLRLSWGFQPNHFLSTVPFDFLRAAESICIYELGSTHSLQLPNCCPQVSSFDITSTLPDIYYPT